MNSEFRHDDREIEVLSHEVARMKLHEDAISVAEMLLLRHPGDMSLTDLTEVLKTWREHKLAYKELAKQFERVRVPQWKLEAARNWGSEWALHADEEEYVYPVANKAEFESLIPSVQMS